jgi:hypothetical protein
MSGNNKLTRLQVAKFKTNLPFPKTTLLLGPSPIAVIQKWRPAYATSLQRYGGVQKETGNFYALKYEALSHFLLDGRTFVRASKLSSATIG